MGRDNASADSDSFLVLPLSMVARTKTDVVVMKNGDHLTGEIKGLSEGVLYLDMEYILGTSSVQWSKVEHLESEQLFLVKTEEGSVYTGTLSTADTADSRPVQIQVAETSGAQVVINRTHVVEMDTTSDQFFQRFNGYIDTGISTQRATKQPNTTWAPRSHIRENAGGRELALSPRYRPVLARAPPHEISLNVDAFRLMRWNNWFYEGLGTFLQSTEQAILRQGTYGGGVGRYLKNTDRARITLLGGVAGQDTEYRRNLNSQSLASGLVAANLQFFWFNKTNGELNAVFCLSFPRPVG